ncbi:MoaD/ThiS family protein [Neomegalonema sp.]|uniref:MoaD/ThiS family protein n=1 Tax=Neomegalonema sp. TaxID=2039713 RepID=UPI002608D8A7|nr:MoaD/ThiS family protein [Neomegalonema sp.]MDD2870030.1 MoaD/ThiS family protein [Neomegalonema sp.]
MKVLYFAWLRERIGRGEEKLAPPAEALESAAAFVAWLRTLEARYELAFADLSALRVAADQEMVAWDAPLTDVRELAFFPPMTGG